MGPTSGKPPRVHPFTETLAEVQLEDSRALPGSIGCASWATCADAAVLGWSATDPCKSCVGAAITRLSGRAPATGNHAASPAQIVTADVFDGLLNQARAGRRASSISSP